MVLASDTFNRSDDTADLGETDGGLGGPYSWEQLSGTWGIATNQAYESADTANSIAVIATGYVSDVDITVTLATRGSQAGIAFRVTDTSNFLYAYSTVSGAFLKKRVAGATSSLGSSVNGASNGQSMRVVANGPSIKVYNGTTLIISVTDAFNETASDHGLYASNSTNSRFDNFTINALDTNVWTEYGFRIEIAEGQDPVDDASLTWTNITRFAKRLYTNRGRDHFLDQFDVGRASFTLNNSTGAWPSSGITIQPRTPVRISAVDSDGNRHNMFTGWVRPTFKAITMEYVMPTWSEITFECEDGLALLARKNLPPLTNAQGEPAPAYGGYAGDAITDLIAAYPTLVAASSTPAITRGSTLMQPTALGTDALTLFQNYALSEGGSLYVDRDGNLLFDDRMSQFEFVSRQLSAQEFYGTDFGAVGFAATGYRRAYVPNYSSASVQRAGHDDVQSFSNDAYQTGDIAFPAISGALMSNASDATALARRIVWSTFQPFPILQQFRLKPRKSDAILDGAIERELRDFITIATDDVTQGDYHIERIAHTVDFSTGEWDTDFTISNRNMQHFEWGAPPEWLILNDAADGLLDGTRQLAW